MALLVTVLVLACPLYLVRKDDFADSAIPAVVADLPPYWPWLESEQVNPAQVRLPDRPVYAYSVIPGGVVSREELRRALTHDTVAASHYSGFHVEAARPIHLDRARQVYVSYRLGNRVYWTSKKVTLHAGETVLTDGTHLVRGRCGNRISEVPLKPIAPGEPAGPMLNAPVTRRNPVDTVDLPAPPPIWTENPTPFLLAMAPPASGSPNPASTPFVPLFPMVPCCGGGVGAHTPTLPPVPPVVPPVPPAPPPTEQPQPPSPPPPIVSATEPGTLAMLVVGLASLLALVKLRRN